MTQVPYRVRVTFEWTCAGCQRVATRAQECYPMFVLDIQALPVDDSTYDGHGNRRIIYWHQIDGEPYCPECFERYPGAQILKVMAK